MWYAFQEWLGDDGGIAGLPIREEFVVYQDEALTQLADLTGFTGRWALRANGNTGALMLEGTTENGGMVLGGALGTVSLRQALIDPAPAATTPGRHAIAIELFNNLGEAEYVITGHYELRKRV